MSAANYITWVGGYPGGWFNVTNWSPQGVPGPSHTVVISYGGVTVPSDAQFAVLSFNGGTLSGTATISGTMNWSSGTLGFGARITVGSGGVLNIDGSARKVFAATKRVSRVAGVPLCSGCSWAGASMASALSSCARPSSAKLIFFHGSQVVVARIEVAAPA